MGASCEKLKALGGGGEVNRATGYVYVIAVSIIFVGIPRM